MHEDNKIRNPHVKIEGIQMSKLKKEELLKWLRKFYGIWNQGLNSDKDIERANEAYQQIKHAVTVFYNVLLPESKSTPKPEVTKEFVEMWVKERMGTDDDWGDKAKVSFMCAFLKEAGVEVK